MLFTGSLVYMDTLFKSITLHRSQAYLASIEKNCRIYRLDGYFQPIMHWISNLRFLEGCKTFRELKVRASCSMEPVYVIIRTWAVWPIEVNQSWKEFSSTNILPSYPFFLFHYIQLLRLFIIHIFSWYSLRPPDPVAQDPLQAQAWLLRYVNRVLSI